MELHQQRAKIQNLADETNGILKKNVYHNYALFIETAKEISSKLHSNSLTFRIYKEKMNRI